MKKQKKSNSKLNKVDWLITIGYIIVMIGLFDYIYEHEANQDLSLSIGVIFIVIVIAYCVDRDCNILSTPLQKFLSIIKNFLSSPIFIVAIGSIIVFLFLAQVLHFADLI